MISIKSNLKVDIGNVKWHAKPIYSKNVLNQIVV